MRRRIQSGRRRRRARVVAGTVILAIAVAVSCGDDPTDPGADNRAPVAQDVSAETPKNTPIEVDLPAEDADGDPLTFALVEGPTHGTVEQAPGEGVIVATYTPEPGFSGEDVFTYTVSDGIETSDPGTVTITVVNGVPVAVDVEAMVGRGTARTIELEAEDPDGDDLSFEVLEGPANGALGPIEPVPDEEAATDATSGAAAATPAKASGTAASDTAAAAEAADTADGAAHSAGTAAASASSTSLAVVRVARVEYTPASDFTGEDRFTYAASDGTDRSGAAEVVIQVVNGMPVTVDVETQTRAGTPVEVELAGLDPDGDPLTFDVVEGPAHGALDAVTVGTTTAAATGSQPDRTETRGTVTYTPETGFTGTDTFRYTASDGALTSEPGLVTVVVSNGAPVAASQTVSTRSNTAVEITLGASDPNGDPLTFLIVDGPGHGSLGSLTPAGPGSATVEYTPELQFVGEDAFTFRVSDGTESSNVATVTIEVQNEGPTASNASATTDAGTAVVVTVSASDPDDDPLAYILVDGPASGTVGGFFDVTGSGAKVRYEPADGFSGTDTFTYRVSDGTQSSGVATVTVTVANGDPVAAGQSVGTTRNTAVTITLTGSDPNGDPLTFSIVSGPASGTLGAVTSTGPTSATVTYTPGLDFLGSDGFSYRVSDGKATSSTVTVSITVTNTAPTADAKSVSAVKNGGAITITLTGSDPEGDALTFAIAAGVSGGTLGAVTAVDATSATVTYTPAAGFDGTDMFTYTAGDGVALSPPATVTITVPNTKPTADDKAAATLGPTPVVVTLTGTDGDGDPLTFSKVTDPSSGSVVLSGASGETATYTPDAGSSGPDSFTYVANDGTEDSDPATVTITVDGAPTADDGSVTLVEDAGATTIGLTGSDPEGTTLGFAVTSGPSSGSVGAVTPTGASTADVDYTPDADFSGTDSFDFTVTDGSGQTATATVTITVTPVNDPPTLTTNVGLAVDQGATGSITAALFAATDPDDGPAALTFTVTTAPVNGRLELSTDPGVVVSSFTQADIDGGLLRYVHDASETTSDSFIFDLDDAAGAGPTGLTFSITVNAVNNAPTITAPASITVDEDVAGPVTGISFADPDAGASDVVVTLEATNGTLAATTGGGVTVAGSGTATLTLTGSIADINTFIAGGNVEYTTALDDDTDETLNVSIDDQGNTGSGGAQTAGPEAVTIDITPVNDAPVLKAGETLEFETAGNTTFQLAGTPTADPAVFEDSDLTSTLVGRFEDPEGDPFTLDATPTNVAAGASIALNADGTFTYTPTAGATVSQTFDITITDNPTVGTAESTTETVTVTITDMVWYVDRTVAGGTGTSAAPFDTPGEGATAGGTGDKIFVFEAGSGTTAYDGGVTLKASQQLLGEPEGLSVTLVGAGATQIVAAGATRPTLENTTVGGDAITLASGSVVRSFIVSGASDAAVSGSAIAGSTVADVEITGAGDMGVDLVDATGTVAFTNLDVSGTTGTAINVSGGSADITFGIAPATLTNASGRTVAVDGTTGGAVTFSGGPITQTSGTGLHFTSNAATIDIQQKATVQASTDIGVRVDGSSGDVTFADLDIATSGVLGASFTLNTGTVTVTTGTITTDGASALAVGSSPLTGTFPSITHTGAGFGVFLETSAGTKSFGKLDITSTSGTALFASSAGTVNVTDATSTLTGTGAIGLDVRSTAVSATFASVSSSTATEGINLDGVTGTLTINGGSITGATGIAFDENATSANVSYAGSITNTASRAVDVTGRTSGTLTLSGAISETGTGLNFSGNSGGTINLTNGTKTANTGTSTAVTLSSNTGATINFTGGGLDIDATTGKGFSATGGGTVTVQGTGNFVTTTSTGTPVEIQNTTIGASGVTFESVSANGAANGILLNGTGSSGGLTITGDGSNANNASGGTIQSTSSHGIQATNTRDLSLTSIRIQNPGNGTSEHGILATGLSGTSLLRSSTITGFDQASGDGFRVVNNNVNLTELRVNNSTFSASDGNDGLAVFAQGSSQMTIIVENGSLFTDLEGDGLDIIAGDLAGSTASVSLTVDGSSFTNAGATGNGGIQARAANSGSLTGSITNNTFNETHRLASTAGVIEIQGNNSGSVDLTVSGNDLDEFNQSGINVVADDASDVTVDIDGNSIDTSDVDRIGIRSSIRNTGATRLTIQNNLVGQTTAMPGSVGTRSPIDIEVFSDTGPTDDVRILVDNNQLRANKSTNTSEVMDIFVDDNADVHLTVTNNTFTNTGTGPGDGAEILTDEGTLAGTTLCLDLRSNTATNPGPATGDIELVELAGTYSVADLGNVAANNLGAAIVFDPDAGSFTNVASCLTP